MKFVLCVVFLSLLTSCSAVPTQKTDIATRPTTEPAPQISANPSGIDADGYLQPVNPLEVRIRPKAYNGELTITSIVANGSSVKRGDVLLQLDAEPLNRQLAAANNELIVAQANADHADADAKIAVQSDALSLRQAQDAAHQADEGVKWWNTVDGPQMMLQTQLGVKEAKAQVDDEQDELNQLKKMYKSEELTNATADIVVKRALRTLDVNKARLSMTEAQAEKFNNFEYPVAKQRPLDAQTSAHLALEQLQLAQVQGAALRKAGLVTVHTALDEAQRKVKDLESDAEQMIVHAPFDGIVAFGPFVQGVFQGDPHSQRPGEKVSAQQVLMTLFVPGKLNAHIDLPEAKFAKVRPNLAATVQPEAFPDVKLAGVCDVAAKTPSAGSNGPGFVQTISLHDPDPRLVPGSKVKVHIDPGADGAPLAAKP